MTGNPGDRVDAADRDLLEQLAALVSGERRRLLYVDYREAEEDCERLAGELVSAAGHRELSRFAFRPIPRGGLIVLGMLAYLLDLPAERLATSETTGEPLVLVDDCALTGARFAAALRASAAREVVFAHLRSPAALRAAIEAREPRVCRCLAARDLADHTDAMPESERAAWREHWRQRLGPDRYYLGRVEPVAFAWSEPDRLLWNRASARIEEGWRLASPSECLRTRGRLGSPAREPAQRLWRAAAAAASADTGESVLLCNTDTGRVIALRGTAAAMWRRLARHGDPRLATAELAGGYDVELATLRRDLDAFAGELAERGLLEPVAPGEAGDGQA